MNSLNLPNTCFTLSLSLSLSLSLNPTSRRNDNISCILFELVKSTKHLFFSLSLSLSLSIPRRDARIIYHVYCLNSLNLLNTCFNLHIFAIVIFLKIQLTFHKFDHRSNQGPDEENQILCFWHIQCCTIARQLV